MEEPTKTKKYNPVAEIIFMILAFGCFICLTYFACLFVVATLIAAVVFGIIYGVCHTVLEFVRILKNKDKQKKKEQCLPS